MLTEHAQNAALSFLTGYAKRWMEGRYDSLMQSAAARPILELGKANRYGIEAGLYGLLAFMDQQWKANTPLQHFFKEIAKDAAPEIGKRLVNGFRERVVNGEFDSSNTDEKEVLSALLGLDDEALGSLLKWYSECDAESRSRLLRDVAVMTHEELTRLANLPPEQFRQLMEMGKAPAKSKKELAAGIRADLDAAKIRLKQDIRQRTERRKA